MKVPAMLLTGLVVLLCSAASGALKAQSADDLAGYTWKDQPSAIITLTEAQKTMPSNDSKDDPTSLLPLTGSKFKTIAFTSVLSRIENGITIQTAIWEGYSEAVQTADSDPAFGDVSDAARSGVFENLITLLKL